MTISAAKTWFITGGTRGLGAAIAQEALASGDKVVVTGRSLAALQQRYKPVSNLLMLELDVCSTAQIEAVMQQAFTHFGSIDVLVNNAGYGQLDVFEQITAQQVRQQFETNVFGLISVTRAVLPYMRQQRSGQIYNLSSIGGALGFAAASVYCASKFAVEGFSESLAQEVKQFGIGVTIVQPGFFRTDFLDNTSVKYGNELIADYSEYAASANTAYQNMNHQQAGDPLKLAAALVKLSDVPQRPLRLAAGSDAIEYLTTAYKRRQKELADWHDWSVSTDIED